MISGLRRPNVAAKSARVNGKFRSLVSVTHAWKCSSAVSTKVPSTSQMTAPSLAPSILHHPRGAGFEPAMNPRAGYNLLQTCPTLIPDPCRASPWGRFLTCHESSKAGYKPAPP